MFKIAKIEVEGFYDTRRVTPWDYEKSVDEFKSDHKIILPSWGALKRIGDTDDLWILLDDHITVTATDKKGNWRQWRFDRGFIWDQASVPLFRNNRLKAIIAAMCHDAAFSLHWYSFDEANDLFKQTCRYFGMNIIQAWIYHRSVASIFGRAFWENNTRAFWHKKTAHYMEGRASNRPVVLHY